MFPNADRVALDSHPYLAFGEQSAAPMSSYANTPCTAWGASVNSTMTNFGLFNAGEFSNAVTDCGLFLNEVGEGTRYEGTYTKASTTRVGSCTPWTDWTSYDAQMKADIKQFALASMDALQVYFPIPPSAHSKADFVCSTELLLLDLENRQFFREW